MADFTLGTANIPLTIKFRDEEGEDFLIPSNVTQTIIKLRGQNTNTEYSFAATIQYFPNGYNYLQYILSGTDITVADTYNMVGQYLDSNNGPHFSNPPYPTIVVVAPLF
jgi:hypothetical protein